MSRMRKLYSRRLLWQPRINRLRELAVRRGMSILQFRQGQLIMSKKNDPRGSYITAVEHHLILNLTTKPKNKYFSLEKMEKEEQFQPGAFNPVVVGERSIQETYYHKSAHLGRK